MCGISGIYSLGGRPIKAKLLQDMNDLLKHRGPDGQGYMLANTQRGRCEYHTKLEGLTDIGSNNLRPNLGFAHRRLSIIDLSDAASQPMSNENDTIWIILNGEIFNYVELREELKSLGHRFKSRSDTEVILHAYESFGFDCVKRFNGMWAFALWDSSKRILFCSRDRFGIKPFYYRNEDSLFSFASEIKSLLITQRAKQNEKAIFNYLLKSFGLMDMSEDTFFKGIYQLLPAHNLIINPYGMKVERYWEVQENSLDITLEEAIDQFRSIFVDAIKIRMRSDVKIAGALSGGMDSSSIACVIKKILKRDDYETYSACFDISRYDERPYIQTVTKETGFKSHYVFPDSNSLFDVINEQLWFQDEPFNAMWVHSQWSVYQKAARNGVKVFLNGHASDESLGGYYPHFDALWAEFLRSFRWASLMREIKMFRAKHNGRSVRPQNILQYILTYYTPRVVKELFSRSPDFLNQSFLSDNYKNKYRYKNNFRDLLNRYLYESLFIAPIRGMLHFDDRNSMANSIETRVPFLDYRLIEFAFSLPGRYKLKDGLNKFLLRESMRDILPQEISQRYTKKGFSSAAPEWFREKKDFIRDLFESREFKSRGYFNPEGVRKSLDMHCEERVDLNEQLCSWITLELWFRRFIDNNGDLKPQKVFADQA